MAHSLPHLLSLLLLLLLVSTSSFSSAFPVSPSPSTKASPSSSPTKASPSPSPSTKASTSPPPTSPPTKAPAVPPTKAPTKAPTPPPTTPPPPKLPVPLFQEVFLSAQFPGNVTHMAVSDDGAVYLAGVSPVLYDEDDEDFGVDVQSRGNHIFFGKFVANQFLWMTSFKNFGDDPQVFSLVLTDAGFALIGSFTSTLVVESVIDEYLVLEPTNEAISLFVVSFNDYGSAIWGKAVGVDWNKSQGPFSIASANGFEGEIIITGNLLKNLDIGGSDQKGVAGSQTFYLVFDASGNDLSLLYTLHRWNEACEEEPCENGGECDINRFAEGFYCHCVKGFTGVRCEIPPAPKPTDAVLGGQETQGEDDDLDPDYEEELYEDLKLSAPEMDEDWDDEDDKRKRGMPGRFRRNEAAKEAVKNTAADASRHRSVFTHSETYLDEQDNIYLFSTGYNLTVEGFSVFVHLYQVFSDDIDLIWSLRFPSGRRKVIPSLKVYSEDGELRVAIAGTLSMPSTFESFPFEFPAGADRVIYVAVVDIAGDVQWVNTVTNIGRFHDEPSLFIPITVNCEEGEEEEACDVVVAGPSTNATRIGQVSIDSWPRHQYFLASIGVEGNALWIKELFSDVEFGEIRALSVAPSGNIWAVGAVSGMNPQFDFISGENVTQPSFFITKVGFIEEQIPYYDKYIAPIVYSEKQRPLVGGMFFITAAILIGIMLRMRFGRRFA